MLTVCEFHFIVFIILYKCQLLSVQGQVSNVNRCHISLDLQPVLICSAHPQIGLFKFIKLWMFRRRPRASPCLVKLRTNESESAVFFMEINDFLSPSGLSTLNVSEQLRPEFMNINDGVLTAKGAHNSSGSFRFGKTRA